MNTTGDGFVATFDAPTAAVRAALAIIEATKACAGFACARASTRASASAAATISPASRCTSRRGSARMPAPNEVLVSRTVCDVVAGSGLALETRGEFELKGVPQRWELFAVRP